MIFAVLLSDICGKPLHKKGCQRHGDCVVCEEYHAGGKRLPYCMREKGAKAKLKKDK